MKRVIEDGIILKITEEGREPVGYSMIFLDEDYLDEALTLQELIQEIIRDDRIFAPDTREYISDKILAKGKGRMMGIIVDNKLIAYRTITFETIDIIDAAKVFQLHENEIDKMATLVSTVVHPSYRGNRLQKRLLSQAKAYLSNKGYHHLFTTISPCNYPSLKNMLDAGFLIKDLKRLHEEYEGRIRLLLTHDMRRGYVKEKLAKVIAINSDEILQQKEALASGLVGYGLEKNKGGFKIIFGAFKDKN